MSRIQSSVGLITGIPIEETVTKLMALAARPRDLLNTRTQGLKSEQLAVTKLTSLVLALQFETNKLSSASLFQTKQVVSSNDDVLSMQYRRTATRRLGRISTASCKLHLLSNW